MNKQSYIVIIIISILLNVFLGVRYYQTQKEEEVLLKNNIEYIMLHSYNNLQNFKINDEIELKTENIRDLRLFLNHSIVLQHYAKLQKYNVNFDDHFIRTLLNQVNKLENTINQKGNLSIQQEEYLEHIINNLKIIVDEIRSSKSIRDIDIDNNTILEIMRISF